MVTPFPSLRCLRPSHIPPPAILLVVAIAAGSGTALAAEPAAASPADARAAEALFEQRVRPVLVSRCQGCHGSLVAEAGLRLDSRQGVEKGADSGRVIVPGDPAASRLVQAIRRSGELAMPPDDPLPAEEVATLEAWVAAGAPWPDGATPTDITSLPMAERIARAREGHWAFRPPLRHAPPAGSGPPAGVAAEAHTPPPDTADDAGWSAPIDRFLLAALTAAGLTPSAPATPRDLHRRVWFDLTGLPPPADAADAFAAAPTEEAYRATVEQLLASPEHAEHWARKWLDLARYADTMGYAFANQDPRYPFAWTYRDWVVRALRDDIPYDRFVTLQLAADRIEPAVDKADLAALGFLTVGRTFLGNTHDIIDDRIDLVTRGLMGLTVACARCHDHKYEPVAMADYYALHGIFASSRIPEALPVIGAPPPGPEAEAFATKLAGLQAALPAHEAAVQARGSREAVAHAADYFLETARPAPRNADNRPPRLADDYDLQQFLIDRLAGLVNRHDAGHPLLGPWVALKGRTDAEFPAAVRDLLAGWGEMPAVTVVNPLLLAELRSADPQSLRALAEVYARLVQRAAPEMAGGPAPAGMEPEGMAEVRALLGAEGTPLVLAIGEAMRVATVAEQTEARKRRQEITRHEAEAPGAPPKAMVLVDVDQPHDSQILLRGNPGRPGDRVQRRLPEILGAAPVPPETSGRLQLARAIVAPDNPLTARVLVNWVWTHHFGTGLVATPGDLGLRGEAPSHPELLDDLARRFIEEGAWSLRWLHREIVTSRAWRQSSLARDDLVTADPDNHLFARANRRRLDWEAFRDSLLTAAGTLSVARRGGPGSDPLSPESSDRRSLYTRLDRQDVPGTLRIFDLANPDTAVHMRQRTTVPQQSLAVLNAPLVVDAARRVAERSALEAAADAADSVRLVRTWRAVLSRDPIATERATALDWLAREREADAAAPAEFDRWARLAQALLATAEFEFID
ncbi:MAG: DUF1553 domain-containing protein [Planctomycetia bacterium]|nr:DUF1553 domain-containing protein [Planctomycetia bacterium]